MHCPITLESLLGRLVLCLASLMPLAAEAASGAPAINLPLLDDVAIDGRDGDWGERGYRLEILEPMGGPEQKPRGQRVAVRLGWNGRGLLVLVRAWDDAWRESAAADRLQEGDSLEAFLAPSGDKGYCQWAISPGMDPEHPEVRSHVFDSRKAELRALPAEPVVARTRSGGQCVLEALLPWASVAIDPAEGTELQFWCWVNDRDDRIDEITRVWKSRFVCRLSRDPSPSQRFLWRQGFSAKAMLATIRVEGGADEVGRKIALADAGRRLAEGRLGADESGYAVADLLVPEHAPGAPPRGELAILVEGQEVGRTAAADPARQRAEAFLFSRLKASPGALFSGRQFPAVDFEDPSAIARAIGPYQVRTGWYDSAFQPVEEAAVSGRYGAVVTVVTADGRTCRRFLTLFRRPEASSSNAVAAVDVGSGEQDRQWWVDFKRKFYGWDKRWPQPFVCPRPVEGPPAPAVREGTLPEAGMQPDAARRIDAVLARWAADSDEPFSVCIVRRGVIVLHKAYGTQNGRPMKVEDACFLASLTKLLSGTLLLAFVDQGLVDPDAPVANYLPPFAAEPGSRSLTVRHLYTHTSGFAWHWGGWENDLEERLAFYMPHARVAERFEYNGTGFDLGTKILEAISGEAWPGLYRRHIFEPLGCRGTSVQDGGGTAFGTALDLARIGQMLLNRGAYGNLRFMKEETFRRLLPVKLTEVLGPQAESVYGLGAMWHADEGLGAGTFGHGAKSMTTFRVDPEHGLVIVMARNRPGANFATYHPLFLRAVLDGIAP